MSERSLKSLLEEGTSELKKAGIEEARLDAWLLLEFATGVGKVAYYTDPAQQTDPLLSLHLSGLFSLYKRHNSHRE